MYKKRLGAVLAKDEGNYYVVVFDNTVYQLNEVGARIFDLCTGQNSASEMANKLSKMFDADRGELEEDIEEYLGVLLRSGVIEEKNV